MDTELLSHNNGLNFKEAITRVKRKLLFKQKQQKQHRLLPLQTLMQTPTDIRQPRNKKNKFKLFFNTTRRTSAVIPNFLSLILRSRSTTQASKQYKI